MASPPGEAAEDKYQLSRMKVEMRPKQNLPRDPPLLSYKEYESVQTDSASTVQHVVLN
jgi:hypothetical protein